MATARNLTKPVFTIRRAVAEDVPDLCALVKEYWQFETLFGFEVARVSDELRRFLADERLGAAWIAHQGDQAVGYLLGVYVFSLEHLGMTSEIDEFFVREPARGTGVGGELLRRAEETFRAAGCANVSLQLGCENEIARAFYFKHGFRPRSGFGLLEKDLRT